MSRNHSKGREAELGVYVSLAQLVALQDRARGFSFLPQQPARSLLAGRHASRVRGRGLDFEELRSYRQGDDPRTIDWRVTQRTRKPHVRFYSEERSRPAMVVLDQRIAMFFGTRLLMKSVAAAEIAAAAAWQLVHGGDRLGGIVFNDSSVEVIKPSSRRDNVTRLLGTVAEMNQALHAELSLKSRSGALNQVLEQLSRMVGHDYTLIVVSDFEGADQQTPELLARLSVHNDVICALVFDPSAVEPADLGAVVVSDGELQVELELDKPATQARMRQFFEERMQTILSWQQSHGVTVLPISSGDDPLKQLHRLLGGSV